MFMASGILENDNLFVVGERAWHGLGTVLSDKEVPTSEDAIRLAHLDWTVNPQNVYLENGIVIPNTFANVRSDTNGVLGLVTEKYKICQNSEAFDFVDAIMENGNGVRYESAGSLFNGKKVWLLARMEDRKIMGDDYESYLCFCNSHDGKGAIQAFTTSIRVVCNNTLQLATDSAPRSWSIRHFSNLDMKKREAMNTLGLATNYLDEMEKKAENMYVLRPNWDAFVEKLVPIEDDMSERVKGNVYYIRDTLNKIYNEKDDLGNIRGTAYGMYNAVADYVSNVNPLRMTSTWNERKMEHHMLGTIPMLDKAEKLLVA